MDFSLQHLADPSFVISPTSLDIVIFRLIVACLFSFVIFLVNRHLYRKSNRQMDNSLIVLCSGPIVCMILLGIGSSVPRAFGLFAALSLIRFRTPVKDTTDMVFIFFSVGTGIACGAGAINVALAGLLLIFIFVFGYVYNFVLKNKKNLFYLEIQGAAKDVDAWNTSTSSHSSAIELKLLSKRYSMENMTATYTVSADQSQITELESNLQEKYKSIRYSLDKHMNEYSSL